MNNKEIEILLEQKKDQQTPLEILDLSVRSYNCLCRAGIDTVEKLIKISEKELFEVRNLGRNGFEEVVKKIKEISPPIEILNLSVKSSGQLIEMGINTVEKFLKISSEQLIKIKTIDINCYEEIINKIKEIKGIKKDQQTPLEILDLSVRSYNCLRRAGIDTVEKLIKISEKELFEVRNLGRNGFEEVVKKIKEIKEHQQTPLEILDLSVKSSAQLIEMGINTVEKFLKISSEQLIKIKTIDINCYEEIINKIKEIKGIKEHQQTPLEILDLSVRSYNCLCRAGIDTVEKLIQRSEKELFEVRNLGRNGFEEVVRIKNNIIQKLEIENSKNEVGQLKSETTLKIEKLILYKKILESQLEQLSEESKNNGQNKK